MELILTLARNSLDLDVFKVHIWGRDNVGQVLVVLGLLDSKSGLVSFLVDVVHDTERAAGEVLVTTVPSAFSFVVVLAFPKELVVRDGFRANVVKDNLLKASSQHDRTFFVVDLLKNSFSHRSRVVQIH
jgi:hypothetical protein